jgi:hypothetical protein
LLSDPNSGFTATHELARTLGPDLPADFEANDLLTLCRRGDSQSNETEDADARQDFENIDRLKRQVADPGAEEF